MGYEMKIVSGLQAPTLGRSSRHWILQANETCLKKAEALEESFSSEGMRRLAGRTIPHQSREGDKIMEDKIRWETILDTALIRAKAENKPVLLDFFNPG
jgi:hypothetical protein